MLVPLAGIEPALLAESDFESDASTSSAIGALEARDIGETIRAVKHECQRLRELFDRGEVDWASKSQAWGISGTRGLRRSGLHPFGETR